MTLRGAFGLDTIIKIIKILRYLFRPHWKLVSIYLVALIIFGILDIFRISLIYPIINYGLNLGTGSTFIDGFLQFIFPQTIEPFLASAILLAVLSIIVFGVEFGVSYLGSLTFARVRDKTDRAIFSSIKRQPYEYFTRHKQGDLLYIGQTAVNSAGNAVYDFVFLMQYILLCIFYLAYIFLISLNLGIAVIIFGLIYIALIKNYLYTRIYGHGSILTTASIEKSVVYNEFISGIKTIFISDSLPFWTGKYNAAVQKLLISYTSVMTFMRIPTVLNNFLLFMIISIGAIGLYFYSEGNFLPYIGIFGTVMFAIYRLVPSLSNAQTSIASVIQNLPALEAVYSTLHEGDAPSTDIENRKKAFDFKKSITVRNVSLRYRESQDNTINNLSFEIEKNTTVAIVGNSGAGKTTVANLLALLYRPTSGEILIDGTDINEFNRSDYLKKLGYLGQETFIYHDSIKENIRFGINCTDADIIRAAELANAHEFIMATPDGYNTIIGDQGMKLSGGQRQRVAIARVILRAPEILLLDEATSSLDNISEQRVMESIARISEHMTVIIIAHRLSTVLNADVIHVLNEGRICESGTHDELIERKGEYFDLYNQQVDKTGDTGIHSRNNI